MKETIFAEFQYFIRRINAYKKDASLSPGETIEDLEQRFRVQVEKGLVISHPGNQEVAMEILLSNLPEDDKRAHLLSLRKTGKTTFEFKKEPPKKIKASASLTTNEKRERALDLIVEALDLSGVKAQKQPLGVKMLMAEYELKDVDYDDPKDLRLLLVETIKMSGHAKKTEPITLANNFNKLVSKLAN